MGRAISSAIEWRGAQATGSTPSQLASHIVEPPPIRPDTILCNSDAAWSASSLRAGASWCFEDHVLSVQRESSRALTLVSSPLMAEALAMREAVREAAHNSLLNVWFRTDSQELALAINSKIYSVEPFRVLMDIEFLSSSFDFFYVSFIGQEQNFLADSLAKSALYASLSALY